MVTPWCVKVTCLPDGINNDELAMKFGVDPDTIDVPRNQRGPNYYAWVNGFSSEQHANDFAKKWNNQRIRSRTIKCKVSSTKAHVALTRPPSLPRNNGGRSRKDGNPKPRIYSIRPQSLGPKPIRASMMSNKSNINGDSDDEVTHQLGDLSIGPSRSDNGNSFRLKDEHTGTVQRSYPRVRDNSCEARILACRNGSSCFNAQCSLRHPLEWSACKDGLDCEDFNCSGNHPPSRTNPCSQGDQCKNIECKFLHPSTRMHECDAGDQCHEWNCQALHSENRPKVCLYKQQCYNIACPLLHPPDRRVCSSGAECTEFDCKLNHPEGRMSRCEQVSACGNYYCMYLHPAGWDPCEAGKNCTNPNCSHTSHPSDRIIRLQQRFTSRIGQLPPQRKLKSIEQRNIDRQQAKLPILASKDEFCRRLKKQRMLVVRAETGSGKSTQLPQYAAEYFGKLVVCTQPRVSAAISLALRVADEYDGASVGESVGYQVGANRGNNRVPGTDIIFMTDSALIQESQQDQQLSKVKVLIIDEAHERSLNTDIVIGLAKLLLDSRPTDFYVVIASATIDPTQFLTFFNRNNAGVLNVPGRVFDVSLEYMPKSDDSTDNYEVSTLFKLYKDRPQGHILVFLPGQREIEKALALFNDDIPENCVALPLYGSLSPEEQNRVLQFDEGPTGERRMVVFCTNVAETSLTIKNVRLVIDSGLAKEARFDLKRRLTVIETVRISKSSANQRKGRAGRTAPGHCVRLYKEDELTRTNIEPEILRSSPDLVVLQLLRLQLNPSKFPLMNPPDDAVLKTSFQLLRKLGCIDTKEAITRQGELFAELGLDPRLSAFMVDTYAEHGSILQLTATIVAILTAPGSLFFMGGMTQEEKQAARARIAMGALEHNSDLLYLASVYKKWQNVGAIDTVAHTCLTCQTLIKRYSACRSCRVAYTIEHTLNNRILNIIEVASKNAIETITNKRWKINPGLLTQRNENDIIGAYLYKNFPEQHGRLLVPFLPNEGVCMIDNQIRARITNTSVFVQRRVGNSDFIAMSITQLPTGDYVIERLHPLNVLATTHTEALSKLGSVSNVGWEWNFEIRKQTTSLQNERWAKWLVYEYDRRLCTLIVWGEEKIKKPLIQALRPIVQSTRDSLFACTRSIECGPIYASFESGLKCSRIENLHHSSSTKNRIDLQHVPSKNFEELDEWLDSALQVHLRDIRENNFQPCKKTVTLRDDYEAPPFFIVFKSEEMFKKALANVSSFHTCPQMPDSTNILHISEKNAWGRQLLWKFNDGQFISEKDLQTKLGRRIISCKQLGKKLLPGIQLNNMPADVDEAYIRNALGKDLTWTSINILKSDGSNRGIGSTSARVYFDNEQQSAEAYRRLQSNHFQQPHSITIIAKPSGNYKEISVKPSVEKLKTEPQSQTFLCTTRSRQDALTIYSENSRSTVDSSSSVTVTHLELYPNFQTLLKQICDRFKVQVEEHPLPAKKDYSAAVRCILTGESPPITAMAASTLSQATSPIIIKLSDDRQKCFFDELFNEGLIKTWTEELKLSCEKKDKFGTVIEIYGPQIQQGQLMRYIADYSDQFDNRYRVLDISAEAIGYFGRQKAADMTLQKINAKWTAEGCTVTFVRRTSTILIYAQPKVSTEKINTFESEVKRLLDQLVTTDIDDKNTVEQQEFARQCAFCHRTMTATRLFRICGHAYCRCATSLLNQSPMQCPTCHFRIHIQDIQEMFSSNRAKFIQLCKSSIQTYLLTSVNAKDNDQLFCPNDECNGLIIRSQGYQTCLTCGQSVCGICRLIDDELHEGRTCAERNKDQQKGGEFLPQFFEEAEKFTRSNWSSELPPIIRFDHNQYLNQTACESLQRFYNGVESVGDSLPPDIARGFFAFHGTSEKAIEPICQLGFDPSRRRGQAYGPGEYFGVTAAISHGYSRKDSLSSDNKMMIIAFILRCNQVSTRKGFCYVVNNPVDWSAAFNLPVAVVTYGKNTSKIHPVLFPTCTASVATTAIKASNEWKSPFRWHWRQDDRTFEPYNDKINSELEQFYEKWKFKNGPSKVITSPLIRYRDDIPQTYSIDFERNIQRNTDTTFPRRIERRAMSPSKISDTKNWYFRDEHHAWIPYESLIQKTIEDAYQAYRLQLGPSTITVHFPGRPEFYEIDFATGRQMNKTTREIRLIQRK